MQQQASSLPSSGRRRFARTASLTGVALALSLGFGAAAQAVDAYWSAGTTCGNAAPTSFTPGSPITATLCAKNFAVSEYVCDFGTMLQTSAATPLFKVANRTINTDFTALVGSPAYPVTVLDDPTTAPLEWGGQVSAVPPVPVTPPLGADLLLATFTFSTDAAATAGPYTIELGPAGYPQMNISSSSTDCLLANTSGTNITAAMTLTPAAPTATAPVMDPLSCGAALTNATVKTISSFSASGGSGAPYSYECKTDGGTFTSCDPAAGYTTPTLTDGSHTITIHGFDSATTQSPDASCTWTVDTVAPNVAIPAATRPSDPDNSLTAQNPSIVFTATDASAIASVECKLNGAAISCTNTSPSTVNLHLTNPGSQTFTVTATDAAGNTSAPVSYTWVANFTPTASGGATAVPTMSEWSLIILGALLAGLGMRASRRGRWMS